MEGVVEKPDVIGALFGQTEGLFGPELDLRELQKSGRIGRIEINLESKQDKTIGKIVVFVWFILLPAFIFYMVPEIMCLFFGIMFVFVGIPLLRGDFHLGARSQNRKDRSSQESWGTGWSDSWGSGDDGGGWDGGDCGGGGGGCSVKGTSTVSTNSMSDGPTFSKSWSS